MPRKHVILIVVFLSIVYGMAIPAMSQAPYGESQSSETGESQQQQSPGIGVSQAPADLPDILRRGDHSNTDSTLSYYDAKYRRSVVNNALVFQKKMNTGRIAFGRQMESQYFNTRYWEPIYVNGSQFWKLKDGASIAGAMEDFVSPAGGKYTIDCAAAINLLLLKSKLDVVGESNFNRNLPTLIIRGWSTYTTRNGSIEEYQTLEKWAGNERMMGGTYGLRTGDYVYFKNHPMMEGTPEQGENAIYLGMDAWGRPVFFGLNVGIFRGTSNQYGVLTSERGWVDPAELKRMMEQ